MATPPHPGPGGSPAPRPGPYAPPPQAGPYSPPPAQTWHGPNPYAQTPPHPAAGPVVPPPPPPGRPPSPPPRKGRRTPLLAAVLVLLLALAGGSWAYFGSGGGTGEPKAAEKSPPPEHKHRVKSGMSWKAPAPRGEIKDYVASDASGTWFTETTVVKAEIRELKVYSRKDGSVLKKVPLPADICGERPPPHDGTIALAYRDGDEACSRLTLIDIEKGERVWTTELPAAYEDGEQVRWVVMARVEDRIVLVTEDGLRALAVRDGEEEWAAGLPGGRLAATLAVGEGRLLATSYRLKGQTAADYQVDEIDPADGEVRWSWSVPAGQRPSVFASVSPTVVGLVSREQFLVNRFVALDGKGRERSRVRIAAKGSETEKGGPEQTFEPRCGSAADGCAAAVVADDTLYLPTKPAEADSDAGTEFNKLAAFDLGTGKVTWSAAAGDKRTVIPVDTDGGNVIGYAEPTGESGGRLVRFHAGTGKTSLYQQHPDSDSENERDAYHTSHPPLDVYLDRGQFFIVCESLTGSEEFVIVAYQ